jgi:hypothetical protein
MTTANNFTLGEYTYKGEGFQIGIKLPIIEEQDCIDQEEHFGFPCTRVTAGEIKLFDDFPSSELSILISFDSGLDWELIGRQLEVSYRGKTLPPPLPAWFTAFSYWGEMVQNADTIETELICQLLSPFFGDVGRAWAALENGIEVVSGY